MLLMALILVGCGEALEDDLGDLIPDEDPIIEPIDAAIIGQCYQDNYPALIDQDDLGPSELDILIVSYGSINLRPQRDRLADNLDYLIAELSPEIDFRIGVIQGFGEHSSRSGRLYRRQNEPLVLRSDELSTSQIQQHVRSKLNPHAVEVVLESVFGAGSMGMYSLYKALTTNQAEIKTQGMLRDEASLLVIFVSDQADVCAVYPEGVQTRNKILRGTTFTSRANAYQRDCFPGGELLSASRLVNKMNNATNGALSVGGVFYNNPMTVPHAAWKEYGFGYTDIIQESRGISHDLASSNYGEALAKIGSYASANVVQGERFNLQANNILAPTIKAYVDGERVAHQYFPETNQVSLVDGRSELFDVEIHYCERKLGETRESLLVEVGGNHSCALHSDGSVRCWGQNNFGQLGQGHSDNLGDDEPVSSIPPLVFSEPVLQLSAGGFHTCVLVESGAVYCWGRNDFGQLGLGDGLHRGINVLATEVPPVALGGPAAAIYSGTTHNCAIMDNGDVRCWGSNLVGELGTGLSGHVGIDNLPSDFPPLSFNKEVARLDLSSISSHSCALFTDLTMKCWGRNLNGQLGLGDTIDRGMAETLASVEEVSVDTESDPIFIATGNTHTCVLLDSLDMKCWGRNERGQLGRTDTTEIGATDLPSDWSPIQLGYSVRGITTSNIGTCALSELGVKCWGDNRFGQAGVKSPDNVGLNVEPQDLDFIDFGGLQFETIVGGLAHYCGLTKGDGKILCWGDNRQGQLGFGNTISSNSNLVGGPGSRGLIDFGFDEADDPDQEDEEDE